MLIIPLFDLTISNGPTEGWMDRRTNHRTEGWTDKRTDGRTDKASYRVACPQLKIVLDPCHILGLDHASMIVNVSESMQGRGPQVDEVLLTQGRILINADD